MNDNILLIFILLLLATNLRAATDGPNQPATIVNDASVGTLAWSDLGNASGSDDVYTTVVLAAGIESIYVKSTNFGFAVPDGATIDGIEVKIERKYVPAASEILDDFKVRIVKAGTIGATARECCTWPSTDAVATYGGSSDLWGETWTVSDINHTDFGFAIAGIVDVASAGTASIDNIEITIHYTPPAPLPVKLLHFDAKVNENYVLLNWSTASEINNDQFLIQRSVDGKNFTTLYSINGSGTSSELINYQFKDNSPEHGDNYYRLKQVDFDGSFEYSVITQVYLNHEKEEIKIFPNPVSEILSIRSLGNLNKVQLISLQDYRIYIERKLPENTKHLELTLNNIPPGTYLLYYFSENGTMKSRRIVRT